MTRRFVFREPGDKPKRAAAADDVVLTDKDAETASKQWDADSGLAGLLDAEVVKD